LGYPWWQPLRGRSVSGEQTNRQTNRWTSPLRKASALAAGLDKYVFMHVLKYLPAFFVINNVWKTDKPLLVLHKIIIVIQTWYKNWVLRFLFFHMYDRYIVNKDSNGKKCGRRVRPTRYCPRRPLMTQVHNWAKTAQTDHVTVRP